MRIISLHASQYSQSENTLVCSPAKGLIGGKIVPELRQVLLISKEVLDQYGLSNSIFKGNIVISGFEIDQAKGGRILQIDGVKIRINFVCEICTKFRKNAKVQIQPDERGVLGTILTEGNITGESKISWTESYGEIIPFDIPNRIKWYLDKYPGKHMSTELLEGIGLSTSYARALPKYLSKITESYNTRVYFKKEKSQDILNLTLELKNDLMNQ